MALKILKFYKLNFHVLIIYFWKAEVYFCVFLTLGTFRNVTFFLIWNKVLLYPKCPFFVNHTCNREFHLVHTINIIKSISHKNVYGKWPWTMTSCHFSYQLPILIYIPVQDSTNPRHPAAMFSKHFHLVFSRTAPNFCYIHACKFKTQSSGGVLWTQW
jgi:hypothetical protein